MGKQQSPPNRGGAGLGKGKVTPVQIAFLVDRYLAHNGFSATLASFQSEAAELFAKTRTREAPKGLLGLADILDEYISLKEQKIMVEQEKRKVEALLRGISDAAQAYSSAGGVCSPACPPLPSPPQPSPPLLAPPTPSMVATPAGRVTSTNPSSRSPPGPMVQKVPALRSSPAMAPNNIMHSNTFKPPIVDTSCSNKRKNSKPILKAPAAPKKHRGQSQAKVTTIEGSQGQSQSDVTNRAEQTVETLPAGDLLSVIHENTDPFVEGSSIAKNLFSQLPDSNANSTSPKTPQRAYHSHGQKMTSLLAGSAISQYASVNTSKELTPSRCSIISSKTVVVSPFKNECYYAIEKSCCISSSPLKPNTKGTGKRDYVKGRLDFDDLEMPSSSQKPAVAESPASSTDDKMEDIFDLDIPDFDIDFSFDELLVNIDLECEEFTKSCHPVVGPSADSISGSEGESGSVCLEMSQDASGPYFSSVSRIISEEGMIVAEGHESVSSVKTISKCIKILSPAKDTRLLLGVTGTTDHGIN